MSSRNNPERETKMLATDSRCGMRRPMIVKTTFRRLVKLLDEQKKHCLGVKLALFPGRTILVCTEVFVRPSTNSASSSHFFWREGNKSLICTLFQI
ncbi:hypothetical protein [Bacteroides reticulotermitis]|uniref:hypothetical protein n=1 Tax=Bacteroides reticulotermitis TaxID=1133319 RepID=UPI003A8B9BFF